MDTISVFPKLSQPEGSEGLKDVLELPGWDNKIGNFNYSGRYV